MRIRLPRVEDRHQGSKGSMEDSRRIRGLV